LGSRPVCCPSESIFLSPHRRISYIKKSRFGWPGRELMNLSRNYAGYRPILQVTALLTSRSRVSRTRSELPFTSGSVPRRGVAAIFLGEQVRHLLLSITRHHSLCQLGQIWSCLISEPGDIQQHIKHEGRPDVPLSPTGSPSQFGKNAHFVVRTSSTFSQRWKRRRKRVRETQLPPPGRPTPPAAWCFRSLIIFRWTGKGVTFIEVGEYAQVRAV